MPRQNFRGSKRRKRKMKLLSFNKTGKTHITLRTDTGRFTVTEELFDRLMLTVGGEISEECEEEILAEDTAWRAMKKALSLLSFGDNSCRELYAKLCRAKFPREIATECVRECVLLGYIDERRQLLRLIEREANSSLRGREYIIRKLAARGYRTSDIISVLDELVELGEVDFDKNFDTLAARFAVYDDEGREALRHKYGYGGGGI